PRENLMPPGFRVKTFGTPAPAGPRSRFIVSDGVAWVSVFIEKIGADQPGVTSRSEGLVQMGTTAAFTASAAGHRITVVGDVPATTVKAIAAAVQPE
ncbi:MAG TPA: MucB/RseB C-terminal domain-containing protein, partial [Steroidobacteraceae bacterium]|nr:MucB/RseB C-terminal domain-containing protein [Steroidobacteraceae bacterium]